MNKSILYVLTVVALLLGIAFSFSGKKKEIKIGMPVYCAGITQPTPTVIPTETPEPTEKPLPPSVTEEPLDCMEKIEKYTDAEIEILSKCVEAEAIDQGLIGKCLVARVILNRVESSEWPKTIEAVVYQKKQFEVVTNGSIDIVTVTDETREAVQMVLDGWDESNGAMYFRMKTKGRNEWHYTALEFLFDYGDHSFFK